MKHGLCLAVILGGRHPELGHEMLPQRAHIAVAHHLSYFLQAVAVFQDERGRLAHAHAANHVDGVQLAALLASARDFTLKCSSARLASMTCITCLMK